MRFCVADGGVVTGAETSVMTDRARPERSRGAANADQRS